MKRFKLYSIDEVLEHVIPPKNPERLSVRHMFDGKSIKMNSQRYQLFKSAGITCCKCGLRAKYFAMESSSESNEKFHFNLYGINENEEEILFTKDHITPKSLGGKNNLNNYQVMCINCNQKKSNNI